MMYNQQDMQANEELAALFARNLTLQQPPAEVPREQPKQPEPEPITYSITQHYHHSAHIARQADHTPSESSRRSSEPPQTQHPSAELILNLHGIDYMTLSPSQLELFKTADDSQKLRLIELWLICPPANQQENPAVALASTTVEQEEFLAQLRYQRQWEEHEQKKNLMSLDGTPMTPVQTDDGRWVTTSDAEPYMESGYELLARREYEESAKQQHDEGMAQPKAVYSHFGSAVGNQNYRPATDPVYNNDWTARQEAMENQYGRYAMEL
ncbi:hypothetical protein DL771_011919 [Monosporascus sp. 5C6A]|nr:hypothetical protein DL771_011919 [Monosporascus sp. 5C6A]